MNLSDRIAFAILGATISAGFLLPFIYKPLLVYDYGGIQRNKNSSVGTFPINIRNIGVGTARNIIVTMKADNVTFLNFTSNPFLSEFFLIVLLQ